MNIALIAEKVDIYIYVQKSNAICIQCYVVYVCVACNRQLLSLFRSRLFTCSFYIQGCINLIVSLFQERGIYGAYNSLVNFVETKANECSFIFKQPRNCSNIDFAHIICAIRYVRRVDITRLEVDEISFYYVKHKREFPLHSMNPIRHDYQRSIAVTNS